MEYVSNEVLDWVIAECDKEMATYQAQGQPTPANLVYIYNKHIDVIYNVYYEICLLMLFFLLYMS